MISDSVAYFNSNNGKAFLGIGTLDYVRVESDGAFNALDEFIVRNKGKYILAALSYDLKNEVENTASNNFDGIKFPALIVWTPKWFVELSEDNSVYLSGEKTKESEQYISNFIKKSQEEHRLDTKVKLKPRTPKKEYLKTLNRMKEDIQLGNIYEVNYCQEFYDADMVLEDPLAAYFKINELTEAPYSAYVQFDEFHILSASPERFIKRIGNKITSEPIKGTIKRGETPEEDKQLKEQLFHDPKERAENVMIVDLVRNDLSKIATPNSVEVDELFGIYSFKGIHQMISTISCKTDLTTSFVDILKATFPMGSMTGAPKLNAMKFAEEREDFKRGIYSGSVGYIKPNGDFDFNVVIRSFVYNERTNYLSCAVGGAITNGSDPEKEYDECMVKIEKIRAGFNA